MNKTLPLLSLSLLLFLFSCEQDLPISLRPTADISMTDEAQRAFMVSQQHGSRIPGEYILMFKEDLPYFERLDQEDINSQPNEQRASLARTAEISAKRHEVIESYLIERLAKHQVKQQSVKRIYDIGRSKGALLNLTEAEAAEMALDESVASVEANEIIAMSLNPGSKSRLVPADNGPATQLTTQNISAVGGTRDFSNKSNWAFIIDSGIDLDHPDLNVETAYSFSTVSYESDANDYFGHGTHVAGVIGAKNDGKGVVGVASGASMVAVKVLDKNGYGTKDNLLKALARVQYMVKEGDVINISLGTDESSFIDNAIINIKNLKKVRIVVAAGNQGVSTFDLSPAKIKDKDVFVVGSVNENLNFSTFSNYGLSVEFLAPGEGIYSTYKNGKYAWMNGTSMAAPHVAGILLVSGGRYRTKKQIKLKSGNKARVIRHF
ncbi:MAG: S8 family serine peptidase [Bacteroidota bacterium]